MQIDVRALTEQEAYKLLIGCIVPRAIAWGTSVSPQGIVNAAPFSYFTGASSSPPMVLIVIGRREGTKKDTLRNIEHSREFVVNVVTEDLGAAMNVTATDFPPEISETAEADLTTLPSVQVKPPRIAESPISMECRLAHIFEVGASPHAIVVGEVVMWHVWDDLIGQGRIDHARLRPLGRLAGNGYCRLGEFLEFVRPRWTGHPKKS